MSRATRTRDAIVPSGRRQRALHRQHPAPKPARPEGRPAWLAAHIAATLAGALAVAIDPATGRTILSTPPRPDR